MNGIFDLFRQLCSTRGRPKHDVYREPIRRILLANHNQTVRVTEGFSDKHGKPRYWLEMMCSPGEHIRVCHWRYNCTTIEQSVVDGWAQFYDLHPVEAMQGVGQLYEPAVDQWR